MSNPLLLSRTPAGLVPPEPIGVLVKKKEAVRVAEIFLGGFDKIFNQTSGTCRADTPIPSRSGNEYIFSIALEREEGTPFAVPGGPRH